MQEGKQTQRFIEQWGLRIYTVGWNVWKPGRQVAAVRLVW